MEQQAIVSIIILNYHGIQDTLECLKSIDKHKVVVVNIVDKDEKNDEGEQIRAKYPSVDVIESLNKGFSAGNNVGARFALKNHNAQYLVFLNNDTRVDKNAIDALVSASKQDANALAVYSPKIYFESGYEYHEDSYKKEERGRILWYAGGLEDKKDVYGWHRGVDEVDLGQFDQLGQTQFATGCCMLISTESYKKVGAWDEKYFLYFEDMDYSRRVLRKKGKVVYIPQAVVWHKNASSSGGSGSDVQQYYQTRNRMYYGLKYGTLSTKIALVKQAFHTNNKTAHIVRNACLDGCMGRMGKRFHA